MLQANELARARSVQLVLVVTFFLNVAAASVMLLPAATSGSLSLLAGAIDAAFDGAANVVGLFAIHLAARPPDESHPYGHRKFETLVAIGVAVLLLLTCGRLAWTALQQLVDVAPEIEIAYGTLAAPLAAFGLSLIAAVYERRKGLALSSELLLADAGHTGAHAGVALGLFAGLLAVQLGYPVVDPLLALVIAGVIAWTGLGIARSTFDVLADASALDPDAIAAAAMSVTGVVGAHKIRSRGPQNAIAVDLHIQVDPRLGIDWGHAIGHQVQDRIKSSWPGVVDVVVHVEPEWALVDGEIAQSVRRVVAAFPADVHEIRVTDAGRIEVNLHLELDPNLTLAEAHEVANEIEAAVMHEVPEVARVVTHLEPGEGPPVTATPVDDQGRYAAMVDRMAEQVDGLSGAHSIEVVQVAGRVRVSAHVLADGGLPLATAHDRSERLAALVRAEAPELERITIHVEPS